MQTGRTDSTQLCGGSDDNTYYNTRGVLPFCNRPVLIGRQRILEFLRFTSILEPDDSIRYKALGQYETVFYCTIVWSKHLRETSFISKHGCEGKTFTTHFPNSIFAFPLVPHQGLFKGFVRVDPSDFTDFK